MAQCDLIGFNRLGNNVHSYIQHNGEANRAPSYEIQLIQAYLLKANQEPISISDISTLSKMMKRNRRKAQNNRRFRHYNRMMHKK